MPKDGRENGTFTSELVLWWWVGEIAFVYAVMPVRMGSRHTISSLQ